jgi:hydroxypyruvate isomerase
VSDQPARDSFDANISLLYAHLPMLERPAAAVAAGFGAIEVWWPFASPTPSLAEVDGFAAAVRAADTRLVALNLYEGDLAGGDRGRLSWPHETGLLRANAEIAFDLAEATGCRLNALYGNRVDGLARAAQYDAALDNLAHLAQRAAERGMTIMIETLNEFDSPDFPLVRLDETLRLVEDAQARSGGNVAVLFDVYHLHRTGHDLAAAVQHAGERIVHVQLADDPGRGRPGTGKIDFATVYSALHSIGYEGNLGLEYLPVPTAWRS